MLNEKKPVGHGQAWPRKYNYDSKGIKFGC